MAQLCPFLLRWSRFGTLKAFREPLTNVTEKPKVVFRFSPTQNRKYCTRLQTSLDCTERDSNLSQRCSEHQGEKAMPNVWCLVSALQEHPVMLRNAGSPGSAKGHPQGRAARQCRGQRERGSPSPLERQEAPRASSPHPPGTGRPYCTVTEKTGSPRGPTRGERSGE